MAGLGKDYIVWDKAATIRFVKPGRRTVRAVFHIPPSEIARVKQAADTDGRCEPEYEVDILDAEGHMVAKVHKTLYVRRKDFLKPV